jgi:hypothetical protein
MKLNDQLSNRKHSRFNDKRFYTSLDISIIKHDEAIHNAKLKRGILQRKGRKSICVCGCGVEGCFLQIEYDD